MSIDSIIDGVIGREGAYTNNPADPGGPTMWGITERVARANGYTGPMNAMPRETAKNIYFSRYVQQPGFGVISQLSGRVGEELIDTGVNMGPAIAATFFQRALNALNRNATDYPDVAVDADAGPATAAAFKGYLAHRGAQGEKVMLEALNCLQGNRYIQLAEGRSADEDFLYGWLANRVSL